MAHFEIQARPLMFGVCTKLDGVQKELCALLKLPAIPTKLELNAPMLLSADMWIPYPCKVICIIEKCYGRSFRNQVEIRPDKEDQAQLLQMQRGRFSSPQSCSAEANVPGPRQLSLI
jgi:hypothetical protein